MLPHSVQLLLNRRTLFGLWPSIFVYGHAGARNREICKNSTTCEVSDYVRAFEQARLTRTSNVPKQK